MPLLYCQDGSRLLKLTINLISSTVSRRQLDDYLSLCSSAMRARDPDFNVLSLSLLVAIAFSWLQSSFDRLLSAPLLVMSDRVLNLAGGTGGLSFASAGGTDETTL